MEALIQTINRYIEKSGAFFASYTVHKKGIPYDGGMLIHFDRNVGSVTLPNGRGRCVWYTELDTDTLLDILLLAMGYAAEVEAYEQEMEESSPDISWEEEPD
jgi:hypothetical protein